LTCGIIYNWWMGKTKSLGDLILTHAVTNGCLCAYVLIAKKWNIGFSEFPLPQPFDVPAY